MRVTRERLLVLVSGVIGPWVLACANIWGFEMLQMAPADGSTSDAVSGSDARTDRDASTGADADAAMEAATAMLFGGSCISYSNDTWEWKSESWTSQTPTMLPPARGDAVAATVGANVILFGGLGWSDGGDAIFFDTWAWDWKNWTQLNPLLPPPGRYAATASVLHGNLVVFGGYDDVNNLNDTWVFDGTSWTPWVPQGAVPSGRTSAAAAPLNDVVVMFGGGQDEPLPGPPGMIFGDTWEWNGSTWHQLSPQTSPTPRAGARAATIGSNIVLFGGYDGTEYLNETWLWDGINWSLQTPASSPPPRSGQAMATVGDKVVLFGGYAGNGYTCLDDTWEWDGSTWTQRLIGAPNARTAAVMCER